MDEDALEERMAKIRAQNEKIRERREVCLAFFFQLALACKLRYFLANQSG